MTLPQKLQQTDQKLRPAHFRILLVASLGQFLGQGLATLVGIVIPLLQLSGPAPLSSGLQGILGCISLIGIMIGSAVIGNLSDRFGYLLLFRLCPVVCGLAALAVVIFPHLPVLTVSLFVMGFAVGGEYSLDPNYISELMPPKWKVFMVGVAKAIASVGSAFVAIVCFFLLRDGAQPSVWSSLMLLIVGICALMSILRIRFAQSPEWLIDHGHPRQAILAAKKLLGPSADISSTITAQNHPQATQISIWKFIVTRFRKIILTGIPWACEGLGVYGIGIFLPVLIIAFGLDTLPAHAPEIEKITHSVGLTFILCLVMMIGFVIGLLLLKKIPHKYLQTGGFLLCALGLAVLLAAYLCHWHVAVAIAGFILFELTLNGGPHLVTFILPSQVFNVNDRGTGAGLAAAIGKAGAVIGAFFIPVILNHYGATGVLIVTILVMLLGAVITALFSRNL